METRPLSVLAAVRDDEHLGLLRRRLGAAPAPAVSVEPVASWSAAAAALRTGSYQLCLLDAAMDGAAPDALRALARGPGEGLPFVLLLDDDDPALLTAWLRMGATDGLPWHDLGGLPHALRLALARRLVDRARFSTGEAYRTIVENAQDVITILGADGTIRYESPSLERTLGYTPDEMVGQSAFAFIHEDDRPEVLRVFARGVREPGFAAAVEYRFRHRNGTWRTLESRAKNLLHDPVVAGVLVNSRDITDRKAAEEALRRSEARNRALLAAVPDAMLHLRRDGTCLDVHTPPGFQHHAGTASVVGCSAYELLPDGVAAHVRQAVERALETGRVQTFDYEVDVAGERRVREARVMRCGEDEVISLQRDITERKQAEAALLASEQRFRDLFEGSPDAIFVESLEGYVLDANPAACRLHGLTRGELIGRPVDALVPPDRRGGSLETFARLRAGEVGYVESYSLHASGRVLPVEIRATRATYGRQEAVLLHVRDITERREAEDRIRQLKAFYEQVLNDLPADVSVMEPDGRILFLNRTSVRDAEMRAWLIGKTGLDYCRRRGLDPSLAEQRHRTIEQAVAERRIVQFEETIHTAAGETRHILRMASPVVGASGAVEQVIGYGLDITERKRAEEALRQNEALLRTVISNIPVILFAVDRAGQFTLAEGKGLETLRTGPGEAVGRSVYALSRPLPGFVHDVERALAGETFATLVDLSGRAFECWLSPLAAPDGTVVGAIGVAADVTDMKRHQAELKASQEQLRDLALHLQSVREEERTRISREVHDVLGQALTALRMEVAWIERGLPDGDVLHDRVAAMKQLIDATIQTVRRIASDLRPGILDDLGLAAALEWQAQQFEARTGIACSFTDRIPFLELDRDRSTAIFRIFQEILTNVARHAEASAVDILLSEAGGVLVLEVRDDGRGIEPEELENRKSLGLLGMRERVVPWGGRVHLEGAPGRGTRVTVAVPVEPVALPA